MVVRATRLLWAFRRLFGTTVKAPDKLPKDLLADEKHTRFNGEKAYVATTVGDDCSRSSLTLSADNKSLPEAYRHFKTEAQNVAPDNEKSTPCVGFAEKGYLCQILDFFRQT